MGLFSSVLKTVAGPLLGSVASGLFSAKQASDNRAFQQENSNTSYRRAVVDMRAAGLNPILAAKIGGASTPSGAMANIPDLGASINSAFQADASQTQATNQGVKIDQEVENLQAQEDLTDAQTANVKQLTQKAWEETNNARKTGLAKDYDNIAHAIVTKFIQDNPNKSIIKHFGMDLSDLSRAIGAIIGGGLIAAKLKPKSSLKKGLKARIP